MHATRSTRSVVRWLGLVLSIHGVSWTPAVAQTVLAPWGNVQGLRVSDELLEFEAGPRWVHPEWSGFSSAVKYLQRPRYTRTGPSAVVDSEVEGVAFREELQDTNPGEATLRVQVTSRTNLSLAGAFFCFDLPDANWAGARCRLEGTAGEPFGELRFGNSESEASGERARRVAEGERWGQSR